MATLQELTDRFRNAGTTDETAVLSQEELADPKLRNLAELAKQNVAAEQRTSDIETRRAEEEQARQEADRAKKEKMASAFGLSEEEKSRYLARPQPSVSNLTMPPAAAKTPEMPSPPAEIEKEQPSQQTATLSRGGAEPGPAEPEPTKTPEQTQDIIGSSMRDIGRIQNQLGANKEPDRKTLNDLMDKLDSIKPDTETYRDPIVRNFLQDKAELYRAYKEKADRNEWLELAQNLVNSLTQFASTQAVIGTGRVGGGLALPQTDYGARTERAFREYRAQAGDISEEEKSAAAAQERVDRLRKEKMASERATLGERIGAEREKIRQEEADAKQAGRDAISLYSVLQQNKRAEEQNEASLNRAIAQYQSKQDESTNKLIDKDINSLIAKEKELNNKLQAANALMTSDKKNYDKNLAAWAAASGQDVNSIVQKADEESGLFTADKTYIKETLAPQHAADLQDQLRVVASQLEELRAARGRVMPGRATPAAAPQPASTTPAAGGMVTVKLANGKQGSIPAGQLSKFLSDNPGSSQVK